MTKKELVDALKLFENDMVVVIKDSQGCWSNIDFLIREKDSSTVDIRIEEFPVFSQGE